MCVERDHRTQGDGRGTLDALVPALELFLNSDRSAYPGNGHGYTWAQLLGFRPQAVRHLWEAGRLGLGETDVERMSFPVLSLKDAIEALPEQFRMAVLLGDVEGFSYKEIAEILDVPIGTVMSRLHRGRKFLQKRLYDLARDRGIVAARAMPRPAD